jgi:Rrf2 family protein
MACEEAAEPGAIGRPLTVAEVAQREGISVQYASKLFRILGKAGLLESARGCKGGYRLARPAAQITVGEILAVLGGVIYEPETCERYPGDRKFCVHTNDCSIRSLWSGLQHIVDQVLSKVTLNELVGNEQTMGQWIQVHAEDIHLLSPSLTRH